MVNESAVVVFDDERAVANAGVMLPALLAAAAGDRAPCRCACGSRRPAGRGQSGPQGDDDAQRDGARGGLHRGLRRAALGPDRGGARASRQRRRRRWGRFCARSRSGMSASSTGCLPRAFRGRGRPAPDRAMSGWSLTSIRSSARSTAMTSRAPRFGYTRKRGYHPILATRAATGEVLHIRARKGSANTARGALRFVEELIPRVARAGATRPEAAARRLGVLEQEDHGPACRRRAGATRSESASRSTSRPRSPRSPSADWQPLADYPDDGEAQIAQTMLGGPSG